MNVTGTFSLTCSKCGAIHNFQPDDTDFDIRFSHERQMGEENGYVWEQTFICDNDGCENEIGIKYQVWEYPIGAFNHEIIDIEGGKEVGSFDYNFHYPDEEF